MSSRFQRADLISTIVIIGFFLSVCFHYVLHFYLHRQYPSSTFLFDPGDRQADYQNVVLSVRGLDPYHYRGGVFGNYFPVTYAAALLFGSLHRLGLILFLLVSLAGTVLYFYRRSGIAADPEINRTGKLRLTFVLTVMSYPLLFELDRANFESLTFLLVAACTVLIGQRRFGLSAVALALAIAMKGYPIVFLGLYVPDKRYREAAAAVVLSAAVCIFCFSVLHGGIAANIHTFALDLKTFQENYVIQGAGTAGARLNCSFFAPLGLGVHNPSVIRKALTYYDCFALVCAAGLAWLITAKKAAPYLTQWKLEYLLAAAALLLPFISYDYKLLVLFIPLTSFLNSPRREARDAFYCASFGAMLIPKDYILLGGGVSISSILEPAILIITAALIVRDVLAHAPSGESAEDGAFIPEKGKTSPHGSPGTLSRHSRLS